MGQRLEKQIHAQTREIFDTYRKMQIELNIMEEEELFLYAFRLGTRMLLEILSPCDGMPSENF